MRGRAVGLVLLGLGTFMLVAALAVRFILVPELVKLPLDQSATPTGASSNLDYFDFGNLSPVTGATGTSNQTVVGEPNAPEADGDTAVWNFGNVILNAAGDKLTTYEFRVCLDRKTGESVGNCSSASVDGDPAQISGLSITFPLGTEKKTYQWFNPTVGEAFPAEFQGERVIRGVTTYKFVTQVPATTIRQEQVPAALAGATGSGNVTADVVYSNTRTMYVEPTSGVIISAEESPNIVFQGPDGTTGVTYLSADFAATDETIGKQLTLATDSRDQIRAVKTIAPIALGILGLLLIVGGVLLVMRAGGNEQTAVRDRQRYTEDDDPDREFFELQGGR